MEQIQFNLFRKSLYLWIRKNLLSYSGFKSPFTIFFLLQIELMSQIGLSELLLDIFLVLNVRNLFPRVQEFFEVSGVVVRFVLSKGLSGSLSQFSFVLTLFQLLDDVFDVARSNA